MVNIIIITRSTRFILLLLTIEYYNTTLSIMSKVMAQIARTVIIISKFYIEFMFYLIRINFHFKILNFFIEKMKRKILPFLAFRRNGFWIWWSTSLEYRSLAEFKNVFGFTIRKHPYICAIYTTGRETQRKNGIFLETKKLSTRVSCSPFYNRLKCRNAIHFCTKKILANPIMWFTRDWNNNIPFHGQSCAIQSFAP